MADEEFIQVCENEGSEVMEFPLEDDGTILLRTIKTQFPSAIGLKYKGPTGAWRAIKEGEEGNLLPPKNGWGDMVYCLTFSLIEETSRKRKAEEIVEPGTSVTKCIKGNYLLQDLCVVGIPYDVEHSELKQYFQEKYGNVAQLMIKFDKITNKAKGFGFIRFTEEESAKNALEGDDIFQGRKIAVKRKTVKPMKMFVNSLPHETTKEELVEYFSQYGEVSDCHVPRNFRHFAFFTFASHDDGFNCLKLSHTLRGRPINVSIRKEDGVGGMTNQGLQGPNPPLVRIPNFSGPVPANPAAPVFFSPGPRGIAPPPRIVQLARPPNPQIEKTQLKNMLYQFLSG